MTNTFYEQLRINTFINIGKKEITYWKKVQVE